MAILIPLRFKALVLARVGVIVDTRQVRLLVVVHEWFVIVLVFVMLVFVMLVFLLGDRLESRFGLGALGTRFIAIASRASAAPPLGTAYAILRRCDRLRLAGLIARPIGRRLRFRDLTVDLGYLGFLFGGST